MTELVNDSMGNIIWSFCGCFFIQGDKNDSLPKHVKPFNHKCQVFKEAEFSIVKEVLRDSHMSELANRG